MAPPGSLVPLTPPAHSCSSPSPPRSGGAFPRGPHDGYHRPRLCWLSSVTSSSPLLTILCCTDLPRAIQSPALPRHMDPLSLPQPVTPPWPVDQSAPPSLSLPRLHVGPSSLWLHRASSSLWLPLVSCHSPGSTTGGRTSYSTLAPPTTGFTVGLRPGCAQGLQLSPFTRP